MKTQILTGAQFSTYRIGGPLEEVYQPESREETLALLTRIAPQIQSGERKITLLGWGGNTIIASQGISGITIVTRKLTWIDPLGPETFRFAGGVHLAKASKVAQQHALTGAEYMIGIPGTIGGAIRMNAGALGQETGQVVRSAMIFNFETGELERWSAADLSFRYRHSAIDPKIHMVVEAELVFTPGDRGKITEMMEHSVQFRKTHHPVEPNGGSVFKNPYPRDSEKGFMTAGWMLDRLEAKTWREGGVMVSPRHANFIVNVNEGTSTDVLRLMTRMKRAMKAEYDVDAHVENIFLGDATEEEQQLWKELTGETLIG